MDPTTSNKIASFISVSWREESAPPVIAKTHKPGKIQADPLHGLYAAVVDGKRLAGCWMGC